MPTNPRHHYPEMVTHDHDDRRVDRLRDDATFEWLVERARSRIANVSVENLLRMRDGFLRDGSSIDWFEVQTEDGLLAWEANRQAVYRVLDLRGHHVRGRAGRRIRAMVGRGRREPKAASRRVWTR